MAWFPHLLLFRLFRHDGHALTSSALVKLFSYHLQAIHAQEKPRKWDENDHWWNLQDAQTWGWHKFKVTTSAIEQLFFRFFMLKKNHENGMKMIIGGCPNLRVAQMYGHIKCNWTAIHFLHTFSMALYHKWDVINGFAYLSAHIFFTYFWQSR